MIAPGPSAPQPLAADHALDAFACGEASLDDWLKKRALKNQSSGASRCFVLCDRGTVVGFYSLSAGGIHHESAPKAMRRNMPDPLPTLLLGRLAIDRRHHNQGLGHALLRDAMLRQSVLPPTRACSPSWFTPSRNRQSASIYRAGSSTRRCNR